jgi:GntR family transcriptional regulator/MocR family aminotransferase
LLSAIALWFGLLLLGTREVRSSGGEVKAERDSMAKQSIGVPLPVFGRLATDPIVTLYRQIYERVRGTVLNGSLAPGTRLPSSRTLAADLGVSRNTVELAFSQLEAEGLAVPRCGFG